MSSFLPLYSLFLIVFLLGVVFYAASRSDSAGRYKFARVRVWVDQNRKRRLPPDDELESRSPYGLVAISTVFLFLLVLWKIFN